MKIYYIEVVEGILSARCKTVIATFIDDLISARVYFSLEASQRNLQKSYVPAASEYNPFSKVKPLMCAKTGRFAWEPHLTLFEMEIGK